MFDTHCHLNFSSFKKNLNDVIDRAKKMGVTKMVVPGTDVSSSQKAVKLAGMYEGLYAAVGIHPHHVYEMIGDVDWHERNDIDEVEKLCRMLEVIAIGEIGMDKHVYEKTKYASYAVDDKFIELQTDLFKRQVELAIKYEKSLIVHNREAKDDVLRVLSLHWDAKLEYRSVFHCCEPDLDILEFAKKHKLFIGVDGDLTYWKEKQEFIKRVPLEMIVLETDAPFLLPEPLRSEKKYPNEPVNLSIIAEAVAKAKGLDVDQVQKATFQNAGVLFDVK